MSNKEEIEKAIEILNRFINNEMQQDKLERDNRCGGWKMGDIYKHLELNPAIKTLLQYIDQLEQENNKLNKMVDEMTKNIYERLYNVRKLPIAKNKDYYNASVESVKQYFEEKVEEK